jgi:glycosyltransferase involved in cell wall biosynthesis
LRWLEQMTFRTAEHVITTNRSYRSVALTRGQLRDDEVTIVRSGPDTERMRPVYPPDWIRSDGDHLLVYLGIMGPQDGVDAVIDVMDELVHRRGRVGLRAVLLGFGDCLDDLRRQMDALGLADHVTFTGRVGPEEIADYLSAADVGLSPDRKTPLNDLSTMNKTMEYMSYCVPSVSFDLVETEVSAGDTALFVPSGDLTGFADAIERLLDDDDLRVTLGLAARARVAEQLDWREQAAAYIGAYDRMFGGAGTVELSSVVESVPMSSVEAGERQLVPLDDELELARFIRTRSAPDTDDDIAGWRSEAVAR